jgi:hypothetical protein
MIRTAIYRALWAIVLIFNFIPQARASTVPFACKTEDQMNEIAKAVVDSQAKADEVAMPLIALGECEFFPEPLFVYIVHKGETFTGTISVTVIGLSREENGALPSFWGMIRTEELTGDGTL